MADVILKNGTVHTGAGDPGVRADVVIQDDCIAAILPPGKHRAAARTKIIDVAGKVVCPGFVDPHSHADMTIHRAGHEKILEPLIRQGITTFVGANCGMSLAPISKRFTHPAQNFIEAFTAMDFARDLRWRDMAGFMERIEENGLALNCALLAPHGMIRIAVMGFATRHADDGEVRRMTRLLEECFDAGCIGMSTGLQYMPGLQSDTSELVRLGAVLKKRDGIYTSHLRSYMKTLPRAIDELIEIARKNDIRGHVSHLLWVPDYGVFAPIVLGAARALIRMSKYWTPSVKLDGDMEKELNKLERFRRKGVALGADVMPTLTTFTHLIAYLPPWVVEGTKDEVRSRIADRATRRKILHDIEHGRMVWPHTGRNHWSLNVLGLLGWESTIIMSVVTDDNKKLEGKTLAEIGRLRGRHPFDAMCDLMIEEEGRILVFSALGEPDDNFTERSIFTAISDPKVSISTDTILMGFGKPSHLFYGAFPKFFGRYVREKKMLSLETAIRKVTGLPAEEFGLSKRGFIREGYFADIVVFDPRTIAPNCDFARPVGKPSGIEHVFINGRHVLDDGHLSLNPLPGRLLRKN